MFQTSTVSSFKIWRTWFLNNFFHAFALNGWAPAPVPPRMVDWTLDSVEGWIVGLLSEFRVFPASCVDAKIFVGTDGSAQNPQDPDTRVAAFSVSWLSEEGEHTFARDLGRVENTVNAAELVAVYAAASAAERANRANMNNVFFLTDHKAVVSGISGSSVRLSKVYLWRELRAVPRRRSCFQVAWVPAHGRSGRGHKFRLFGNVSTSLQMMPRLLALWSPSPGRLRGLQIWLDAGSS